MLETITAVNQAVNSFIWGIPAMVCIIGVGLLLSVRTGFLQLRKFPYAIKTTIGRMFRKRDASDGAMTPFQAVCTALAATVGTGNIAGVAGAIAIGGPGAVFWMWVTALLGASTSFVESTLAQKYKQPDLLYGGWRGGPAYYLHTLAERRRGRKLRRSVAACLFAVSGLICWCGISQVVSNSVSEAFQNAFSIPPLVTTLVLTALAAVIVLRKEATVKSLDVIVPIMAGCYFVMTLWIIVLSIVLFSIIFSPVDSNLIYYKYSTAKKRLQ